MKAYPRRRVHRSWRVRLADWAWKMWPPSAHGLFDGADRNQMEFWHEMRIVEEALGIRDQVQARLEAERKVQRAVNDIRAEIERALDDQDKRQRRRFPWQRRPAEPAWAEQMLDDIRRL